MWRGVAVVRRYAVLRDVCQGVGWRGGCERVVGVVVQRSVCALVWVLLLINFMLQGERQREGGGGGVFDEK